MRKNGAMYLVLLACWAVTLAWFNPRLVSLFSEAQSVPAYITLGLFIFCLDIFWLVGSYFITIFAFSFLSRNRALPAFMGDEQQPRVAVLYLTRNDLKVEAVRSCLKQDYENFHVFILDDSTDAEYVAEVDRLQERFSDGITVVRRQGRRGFKAGALNNALRSHAVDYPYFAIVDADGVIPSDFIKRLMPYFQTDDSIAYVQAGNKPNPAQESKFANDLGLGILPLWTTYLPPRNEFGIVIFLGHGGIVRRDIWAMVGGFPELISEDLAFSTRVRELGYHGYFFSGLDSYEDFPATYRQLRRQQEKYIKGGLQYLLSPHLRAFLRSKNPTWFEKTDLVFWLMTLFLPVFYLFFLLVFALLLPLSFAEPRTLHLSFPGLDLSLWKAYPLADSFSSIWTWDFYFVTLAMMFAPVLGCLRFAFRYPWKTVRLLLVSSVPYLSLMVVSTVAMLTFALTRKAEWPVTGDSMGSPATDGQSERDRGLLAWVGRLNSTHASVFAAELAAGLLLTYACLRTLNVGLFVFSLPLMLAPFVYKFGWENRAVAVATHVPFLMILTAMATLGVNLWGVQGSFFWLFPAHF